MTGPDAEREALRLVAAWKDANDRRRNQTVGPAEALFAAVRAARSIGLDPIEVIAGALVEARVAEVKHVRAVSAKAIADAHALGATALRRSAEAEATRLEELGRRAAAQTDF